MLCQTIYSEGDHRWLAFGQDPDRPDNIVDTNQYVVEAGGDAVLIDPGGIEIFPAMLGALSAKLPIDSIRHIMLSHQDPDIGSSLPLWREVCRDDVQIHISWLWTSFVSHFDGEATLTPVPDPGGEIRLSKTLSLEIVPAHFLHSPGNFHLFDPRAGILFSADVAASLVPRGVRGGLFVEDFSAHIPYMEPWHRRAMGSERARDAWLSRVARLDIRILAPQHGLLLRGDDVKRFYDWFGTLRIGEGIEAVRQE